ncbi:MAG: hypothetical protein FWC79_02450 [Oscillospiraceae bacterium]|nr:hypothetical protein [Oscillospiraceae bacterium]
MFKNIVIIILVLLVVAVLGAIYILCTLTQDRVQELEPSQFYVYINGERHTFSAYNTKVDSIKIDGATHFQSFSSTIAGPSVRWDIETSSLHIEDCSFSNTSLMRVRSFTHDTQNNTYIMNGVMLEYVSSIDGVLPSFNELQEVTLKFSSNDLVFDLIAYRSSTDWEHWDEMRETPITMDVLYQNHLRYRNLDAEQPGYRFGDWNEDVVFDLNTRRIWVNMSC